MNTKFVMDDSGTFYIEVDGKRSLTVTYRGIAVLETGGRTFFGVSQFHLGIFPTEVVLEVKKCEDNISSVPTLQDHLR